LALNYFEEICTVVAEQFHQMPSDLFYGGNWYEIVSLYIRHVNNIALQNHNSAQAKDKGQYPKAVFTSKEVVQVNLDSYSELINKWKA